jgi:spore maturation protein CgeB
MPGKSKPDSYRILFDGERWLGSNAGACIRALRRLGHSVIDVDMTTTIPLWRRSLGLRVAGRLLLPVCIKEHNNNILSLAREFMPHIFLAFKGLFILPQTLRDMRPLGIALYNYYPDVSAFNHPVDTLPRALQEYDCVFSSKTFLHDDMEQRGFPLRNCVFLPHGYDPDAHHPITVDPDEQIRYGANVAFIGGHTPHKERLLAALKRIEPKLDLAIWGDRWNRSASPEIQECIRGRAIYGVEYMKALCATKIVLALLIEQQPGASRGDQITSRTFNIPATGAFMIHQRTDEVLHYYDEGREIECFGSPEELAQKIRFYLANPEKRKSIAQAGYRRCVPAYSHDNRMRAILEWHEKMRKA